MLPPRESTSRGGRSYEDDLRDRSIGFGVARLTSGIVDELERAGAINAFAATHFLEIDDGVETFRADDLGGEPPSIPLDTGEGEP